MKLRTLMFAAALLWSATGNAETLYVTDAWKFEMRETPCFQCKIALAGIPSGTPMETTGLTEEGWTQVVSQRGTTGWMPNNYLSQIPAARDELEAANSNAEQSAAKSELANAQIQQVTRELEGAGIEIEMIDITSDDGLATIQAPRIIGNLAMLGRQNRELLERSQLLQNELDLRVAEIDRLKQSEVKSFFLYGAGAVIAGAFLAIILPKLKPRRSQSEWA